LPEDELLRLTEETARTRPGFMSRDAFYAKLRAQLEAEGTAEVKVQGDGSEPREEAKITETRKSPVPELAFSHLGFHVTDIGKMVDFHQRLLGFSITDRGKNRDGLEFCFFSRSPTEHHQIVLIEGRPPDSATNMHHLAYRVPTHDELMRLYGLVRKDPEVSGVNLMNHGNSWSIYVDDPEGNTIELFFQTPWYVNTPSAWEIDLSLPKDELLRSTEETARTWPGFMMRDAFYAKLRAQLEAEGTVEVKSR
jgi:catechol-2,3-dioxygenase